METPRFTLPVIRTRQALLESGWDDGAIRKAVAAGTLVRMRRGYYADGPIAGEGAARAALAARVSAVAARREESVVFSHATAAALWDLPFLGHDAPVTHVTVPGRRHGATRANVHYHLAPLRTEEIVEHRGVRVTSLARTLVDVARAEGLRQGLVMADHALRMSADPGALRGAVRASIENVGAATGIAGARRMAELAVAAAESPGESLSRLVFLEQQVPPPTLQFPLVVRMPGGEWGRFRTDFAWERQRVVGEFDGKAKYQRYIAPGETPGDAVFREKRREEAMRDADWLVLRWTWDELARPEALGRRVRGVLEARSRAVA